MITAAFATISISIKAFLGKVCTATVLQTGLCSPKKSAYMTLTTTAPNRYKYKVLRYYKNKRTNSKSTYE